MLVLTRKKSEAIRIGNDVFIKVIRTGRSTVKIGIEAPANVRVVRGELVIHHGNDRNGRLSTGVVAEEDAWMTRVPINFPNRTSFCRRACKSASRVQSPRQEALSAQGTRGPRYVPQNARIAETESYSLHWAGGLWRCWRSGLWCRCSPAALDGRRDAAEPTRFNLADRHVELFGRTGKLAARRLPQPPVENNNNPAGPTAPAGFRKTRKRRPRRRPAVPFHRERERVSTATISEAAALLPCLRPASARMRHEQVDRPFTRRSFPSGN